MTSSERSTHPYSVEDSADSGLIRLEIALLVAAGAYIAASLIANVLSVRTVTLGSLAVDAGTLTYPITFTLRDVVHKRAGATVARAMVLATAGFNIALALGIWVTARLPADPQATQPAQSEFGAVMESTWRIVAASLIAQVIAELIDTEIYRAWVARFAARAQWGRVVASNAVSVPVDSALFVLIAFVGVMPASVLREIFWANVLIKGAASIALVPLIYTVKDRVGGDGASASRRAETNPAR